MDIYYCRNCGIPVESFCKEKLDSLFEKIQEAHKMTYGFYLKGYAKDLRWILIIIETKCKKCGIELKACYCSRFFEDSSKIEVEEYNLIEVTPTNFEFLDGIYKGSVVRELLEKFLVRWNKTAMKIILHSPFIGSEDEKTEDWKWILKKNHPLKFLIITRKQHAEYLKEFPVFRKNIDNDNDWFTHVLQETGEEDLGDAILEGMIKPIWAKESIQIAQKSHAKFYAGIINGFVETIITSYNLFKYEANSDETFTVNHYTYEYFMDKFLKPLGIEKLNFLPESEYEQHKDVPVVIYKEKNNEIETLSDKSPISKWDIVVKYMF